MVVISVNKYIIPAKAGILNTNFDYSPVGQDSSSFVNNKQTKVCFTIAFSGYLLFLLNLQT